jgi:NADH-quinone oxidoreductase subunit C
MSDPRTPPESGGEKPPGDGRAEPVDADASRAGEPGPATTPAATPPRPAPAVARPPAPAGKPAAGPASPKAGEAAKAPAPPPGPPDQPPPADLPVPGFLTSLQAAVPGAVEHVSYWVGDWTAVVTGARLLEVMRHLRDAPDATFDFCSDVTAVDWPPRARRFDVVYCLYSTSLRHRVRVKVRTGDNESIASVTSVWPAANWLEREVFDLFGIQFEGHPDLRRILMPDDWQGHPQRKDYPLEGPGELLLESPTDWLKVKQARDIE